MAAILFECRQAQKFHVRGNLGGQVRLCAAMLPPAPSARERLESLDSIKPILLAAMTANVEAY